MEGTGPSQLVHPEHKLQRPSALVSCSSEVIGRYECWQLLDGRADTEWRSSETGRKRLGPNGAELLEPPVVILDLGNYPILPSGIRLQCSSDCPRSFSLSGSHDGTQWELLSQRTHLGQDDFPATA
ncbi:unnamed protein product, partial [Chrysoparadoxa australica]